MLFRDFAGQYSGSETEVVINVPKNAVIRSVRGTPSNPLLSPPASAPPPGTFRFFYTYEEQAGSGANYVQRRFKVFFLISTNSAPGFLPNEPNVFHVQYGNFDLLLAEAE